MERQAGALETPDLFPCHIQAQRESPSSSCMGRRARTAQFCLYSTSTALVRLEMSPSTHREQNHSWGEAGYFLGALSPTKYLTGNRFRAHQEQGPCLCKSDKVTSETKQAIEISGFPGQHQECEDRNSALLIFSLSEEELQQAQRFSASLKNSSLSQAFVPSILQCLNTHMCQCSLKL